jgi:hypothetical protein
MKRRKLWLWLFIGAAVLVEISAISWWIFTSRLNLHITGLREDPAVARLVAIPMTRLQMADMQRRMAAAQQDSAAARELLEMLRGDLGHPKIAVEKWWRGHFFASCPDGPAMVFHLDKEGHARFLFVRIVGVTERDIDSKGEALQLMRPE